MCENTVTIGDIFNLRNIIIYLIIINIIGFLAMFIDKRKAENHKWRIPEKTFFLITLIGGGIGTIAGMYVFRHKTKKYKFTIGLPLILILEIVWIISIYFFRIDKNKWGQTPLDINSQLWDRLVPSGTWLEYA